MTLVAVSAFSVFALGQSSPPNIPAVALSADPLYAAATGDKPALTLALSVEFPTVGAQYRGSNDYGNGNEYLGYYDAESCYEYNKTPIETPASGLTGDDYKRFDRVGPASNRMCSANYPNAFSGNFLNWASNSAIDMLRLALTGGDRSVDTETLTVLQRAFLPDGNDNGCYFNNGSYFPAKQLKRKPGGGLPDFFGAVPTSMAKDAGSSDIWIANMLNRIYFRAGSASTGGCTDQSGYTLGAAPPAWTGSIVSYTSKPSGWPASPSYKRGDSIALTGVQEVLYGNGSNWKSAPASGTITCSETTFTGGPSSSSATCVVRGYSGSQAPPASLSSDPFFYARVSVCNADASGNLQDVRDYGLCTKYPKTYKPTGAIQKYSDQLRLAAFGYLMDQAKTSDYSARYGGVLRAPMKYVGAKAFDDSGNDKPGANPRAEWDPDTGVFKPDPDGPTPSYSNSGVINYLNQFGRTGAIKGRYKVLDPVGELYGEALRYLQGLSPSADAVSGTITAEMYDGFPAFTTWSDPYGGTRSSSADYSCVKSNIVVIGDVNTWDSQRLLTRAPDLANNLPDFKAWNDVVRKFEANTAGSYTDGQGASRPIGNPNAANTQSQVGANGKQGPLVGAAYWAHTHDIRGKDWSKQPALQRPGLRVKSFFFDVNENSASNDAAYRRNQNQYFTAAKYGGFETDPTNLTKSPYNAFGNPFKRQDGTNDNNVWQDPTHPGEASTYYLQSDARGVLSAFDSIFNRASTAARSIAGGAIQSKNLTQAGSTIYQGTFDTSDWSGDLLAIPVAVNDKNEVTLSNTETWTASARLAALATPAATRNIVIGMPGATALPNAVPFLWGSVGPTVQAALNRPSPGGASDGLGQDRLNYLRGDRTKEGGIFRKRSKLLGDIINSGVVYSGAPATNISGAGYPAFYSARKDRVAAVFVGANDGMFHAFNAVNGNELFAYIPSWFAPRLSALTSPGYTNNHQSYADGSPTVGEAQLGSTGIAADWKTVLVAGTGGGGQGVFALDVTDPAAFSADSVLWEFTHGDDSDLGHVVGKPQILKLRTSAPGAKTAAYKWFAVVGSGVNNHVPDGAGLFSATGNAALFLLDLAKPVGTAWSLGTNYYKITLPVDATLAATRATGLVNFRAALGPAREVTQIYLGDLHGNLWKLDFSQTGSSDWTLGKLSPYGRGTPSTPSPLFIAKDAAGNVQPISMAPSVISGPAPDTSYVLFGTGKYLESSDRNSTSQQTIYMIYDNGIPKNDSSPAGPSAVNGRGRLQAGTANASTGVVTVPAFTLGRAAKDGDTSQRSGWYVDFPIAGERQISGATVVGESFVFGSLIPNAAGGGCAAAGGGNQYTMNFARGGGNAVASSVGIMGEPLVTTIPGKPGTPGGSGEPSSVCRTDSTGRCSKLVTSQVIQQGSTGLALGGNPTSTVIAGRLSWRQINNYQDRKNAP